MNSAAKLMALLVIAIVVNTTEVFGVAIIFQKKIMLSQETSMLQGPGGFCVTEDGMFLIPDYKEGNVKIYENNGKFIGSFGRKGQGPGEFVDPYSCFFNRDGGNFCVLDLSLKKIFFYERKGKTQFKRIKEIFFPWGGNDFQMGNNKLFISGYKCDRDSNPFDLYYIDLTNNQTTFLLPSYYKYGLQSYREYEIFYKRKKDIPSIGIWASFDIQGDDIYFAWEGDLRIIKLNIKSGAMTFFGKKTPNYVKPYASKKIHEAFLTRDFNSVRSERSKMSYVRNVFTSSKYVLVIYEGPAKEGRAANIWLQFYTLTGDFIKEELIPEKAGYYMYFDKDEHVLYSLSSELDDDLNEHFLIIKYKLVDSVN